MLTKSDRLKNKSGIFSNYRIEYIHEGDEIVRERFFNAQSEDHALEMFQDMLKSQNLSGEVQLIEED